MDKEKGEKKKEKDGKSRSYYHRDLLLEISKGKLTYISSHLEKLTAESSPELENCPQIPVTIRLSCFRDGVKLTNTRC